MHHVWMRTARVLALPALVIFTSTAIAPCMGHGALYGQVGSGGEPRVGRVLHCADDGRMRWGAAPWSGRIHTLRCLPSDGLAVETRHALLARLQDREGGRVHVEVTGSVPAELIIERKPRRDVYLRITDTPDNGQSRGDVRVRSSRDDAVPVIFVASNRQERLVVEAPDWLQWVTVVVNGVVLHDAAWLGN
jgi:hypothetical protein